MGGKERKTRHLTPFERDELLRFFLYWMPQEQRRRLMATYPVHYAILFPRVQADVLARRTAEAIGDLAEADLVPSSGPDV